MITERYIKLKTQNAKIDEQIAKLRELKKNNEEAINAEIVDIQSKLMADGITSKVEGDLKLEIKTSSSFDKAAFERDFDPESDAYKLYCDVVEHEAVEAWTEFKFKVPNVKKADKELHDKYVVKTEVLKIKDLSEQ